MDDRDQRRYDRLTRIQTFGIEHAEDITPGSKAATHFANTAKHVTDLDTAKAGQLPARVSKATLLDALGLDFKNISRTARAIDLTEPGFAAPYRIPSNSAESAIATHADNLLLLLEGQATESEDEINAKSALRARFIAYDIPADFVTDLRTDREALREANVHNQSETQSGVEDTARISQILESAAKDVQELDAIMHNKYTRDPAKLHAWQRASRVERAPHREKKPVPAPPPTP